MDDFSKTSGKGIEEIMGSSSRLAATAMEVSQSEPSRAAVSYPPQNGACLSGLDNVEEQRLIEAAHKGDRAAFQTIVELHQGAVFGYLRSRLLEAADAEDLCQEVFLRSYVGHARFDRAVMIRPWLLGIARNLLREHVRRIKRRKEVAWTELCLRLEDDLIEFESHQFEDVMAHLPGCLDSLGQSARQALDLRYQARLRLAEIGEKLHRSEGAVKLLMFRARQALKRCLDAKIPATGTADPTMHRRGGH